MFGYVKGAFTGAERDKPGRFNEADGGTIFLDEIGDLPIALQAKLLRVLEDREFYPLGSRHTHKVDVRILSASNRDLEALVQKRLFREDLFYRLNVFRILVPDLKDRFNDLPLLVHHILRKLAAIQDNRHVGISEAAMKILLNYPYPGNVRELENILEHALIICRDDTIEPGHLPDYLLYRRSARLKDRLTDFPANEKARLSERERLLAALRKHGWNRSKAAGELGIDRTTLWRKIKKFGLRPA
jgi:transcriptional regulator with PAS, ATPase and Fis domain